jgi:hypothetical protein
MFFAEMSYLLGNYTCEIRYVRLNVYGKVHEGPNNGFIRNMLRFFLPFGVVGQFALLNLVLGCKGVETR